MTSEAAALTEQERDRIVTEFTESRNPWDFVALVESILASRLADSRPVVSEAAIYEMAFLMWCANEGYLLDEDREGLTNWMLIDPALMHNDDREALPGWLDLGRAALTAALPHMGGGKGEA